MRPSAQNAALLAAVPTVLAVALLGYHMGRLSVQAQQKDGEAGGKARRQRSTGGMQHHRPLHQLIYEATGRGFGVVKRVYIVPGGGPGSAKDGGYPPWTAQRVAKALQRYNPKEAETTAFLALGAGSMNAPSARGGNGHVIFESTRIAEELTRGGVPPGSIIADYASWDTVGNAWFARMAIEALLDVAFRSGDSLNELHAIRPAPAAAPPVLPPSPRNLPYAGSALKGLKGGGISGAGDMLGGSVPSPETKKATPESGLLEDSLTDDDDGARRDDESKSEVKVASLPLSSPGEEKAPLLPAARAGEAYEGGEIRQWMFKYKAKRAKARRGPLNVTVFVSDFHAERMDTVFQWVFGLEPSLLTNLSTTVTTVSIDTPVEMWARGPEQRQARVAHEREATEQARIRATEIRTVEEMRAFMTLGAHKGYFNLSHGRYKASAGGGWGGAA